MCAKLRLVVWNEDAINTVIMKHASSIIVFLEMQSF